jgi:hypothetical protein
MWEPCRQTRFEVTDGGQIDSEVRSPDSDTYASFSSPNGRFAVGFRHVDGNHVEHREYIDIQAPSGTREMENTPPDDGEVPPWYENPLTNSGGLLLRQEAVNGADSLAFVNVGDATDTGTELSLLDDDVLGNVIPADANLSETGINGICGIDCPDGSQLFAIRVTQMPLGVDPVVLLRIQEQDNFFFVHSAFYLPHPFATDAMHSVRRGVSLGSEPQAGLSAQMQALVAARRRLHKLMPTDAAVALTPTRCLVRGFVADDSTHAVGAGFRRHSVLRCYNTETGAIVWQTDRTTPWMHGHVMAHNGCFYVSAVLRANGEGQTDDSAFYATMANRSAASLLCYNADTGIVVRVIPNILQPNTPFTISPNGLYCANLHSDGTYHRVTLE